MTYRPTNSRKSKFATELPGVHATMERAGHRRERSIWREVKRDSQRLADALEALDAVPSPSGGSSHGHA
jgi:hypothetical protein